MRRSLVIAIALFVLAFVLVGGPSLLLSPTTSEVAPEDDYEPEVITPEGSESGFWPYLNAREQHEKRSPLNVVVRGETDEVVRVLSEEGDVDWEVTDHDHFDADELFEEIIFGNESDHEHTGDDEHDADDEHGTEGEVIGGNLADEENATLPLSPTDVPWSQADGTTRLGYVDPGDGEGYWTTETLQLEDGEYYGYRYHIRLYESPNPDDQWVVMQTHSEHFDWFTLRHRVDGVEAAQSKLEGDLMSSPSVDEYEDVRRINLGNSGPSDADGWATKVDLTAMLALLSTVGLARSRRAVLERAEGEADERLTDVDRARLDAALDRLQPEHLLIAGVTLAIILGVRILGIALDRHAGFLSVHAIAALLYPVIALGLPIAVYALASRLERRLDAAVAASLSLAVAIWIDYGLVGVDTLPIDVVLQRILIVVAIGLIAGGAANRATRDSRFNDMLLAGVAMWTLVLVGTLFGYL